MKVDARKVIKLEKLPHRAEIVLYFEDKTSKTEGFLFGKPPTRLSGNLHEQLSLTMGPKGTIMAYPPFNQSSHEGIFVAGDCASPIHTIATAQASGTNAGAGATLQLQADTWNQAPIF